jgi:hypothetical protein
VQLLKAGGELWKRVPLFAADSVQPTTGYALKQWFAHLGFGSILGMILGACGVIAIVAFFARRRV